MELSIKLLLVFFSLSVSFKTVEEAKSWAINYEGVNQSYIQELEQKAVQENRDQTIFYPAWVCDEESKLNASLCSQNIDGKIHLSSNIEKEKACLALKIFQNQKLRKQGVEAGQDLYNLYVEQQVKLLSKEKLQAEWECDKYCNVQSQAQCDLESFVLNKTAGLNREISQGVGGKQCSSNSDCVTNLCMPVPLEEEGQGYCKVWEEDFLKQTLQHICTKFNDKNYLTTAFN